LAELHSKQRGVWAWTKTTHYVTGGFPYSGRRINGCLGTKRMHGGRFALASKGKMRRRSVEERMTKNLIEESEIYCTGTDRGASGKERVTLVPQTPHRTWASWSGNNGLLGSDSLPNRKLLRRRERWCCQKMTKTAWCCGKGTSADLQVNSSKPAAL